MLLRPWSLLVIARRYALCVLITAQDVHLFCWHSCAEAKIEHNPLANHFPSGLMAARWLVSFALVFAMPDIAEPVDSWTSSVLNNRARHRYPCVIVSCVAKCPCRTARAHSRRYLINRCWPPRAVLSSVNLNHSGDVEHCPDTLCSDDSGRSELEMMSNFVAQAINSTERRQRGTWLTHSSTLARRTHDDETLDFQFPMLNALFAVCFDIRVWFICKTDLWTGDHMFTRTKLAWTLASRSSAHFLGRFQSKCIFELYHERILFSGSARQQPLSIMQGSNHLLVLDRSLFAPIKLLWSAIKVFFVEQTHFHLHWVTESAMNHTILFGSRQRLLFVQISYSREFGRSIDCLIWPPFSWRGLSWLCPCWPVCVLTSVYNSVLMFEFKLDWNSILHSFP